MDTVKKHLSIRVSGRVQGVCFRAFAVETAERLKLDGFVRNDMDGTVYVEAEGDPTDLHKFVQWCRQGPPSAIVRDVEVIEEPLKRFSGFAVEAGI